MSIFSIGNAQSQRVLVQLCSRERGVMEVDFEPVQHAIRVSQGGVRRLFFYQPDILFPFKGTLLNEYGLVVGKLNERSHHYGVVHVYENKFHFHYQPATNVITLEGPGLPHPSACDYNIEQERRSGHDHLLTRSLVLVTAWWHVPQNENV